MTEEKSIDLTPNEIQMIRSMCQDILISESQNAELATSILTTLSAVETEPLEIPIENLVTLHKRGRPRRILAEMPKEVLSKYEPEPIEVTPVITASVEEQENETQSLVAFENADLIQPKPELNISLSESKPKINFFQHLLQKLRPAARL